jgi:hypothetical protein
MATECHTQFGFSFQPKLCVDFTGGTITSDAGLLLLREFDERLQLTARVPQLVEDVRDTRYVRHEIIELLQRGQAENFIKELKNDLEADRLSCSAYRANAFRLQLHALAYNLIVLFRRTVLVGTELARRTIGSVRLRLFKVAARVRRSCRRLWFHLASSWPHRPVFVHVCQHLRALPPPSG